MYIEKLTEYLNDNGIIFDFKINNQQCYTHYKIIIPQSDGNELIFELQPSPRNARIDCHCFRSDNPYKFDHFHFTTDDVGEFIEVVQKFLQKHNMLPSYILK